MGFNFPNAPTEGQIFAPAGGPDYVFRSGVWQGAFTEGATLTADSMNRVVNGAMQISQENGRAAGGVTGYYFADQWRSVVAGTGFTPSFSSTESAAIGTSPAYTIMNGGSTAKPSLATTDQLNFWQVIEGQRIADFSWGNTGALPIVLRFTAWGGPGTFTVSVRNAVPDRSYVIPFTMTTTAQEFVFAIPGCTDGTWATDSSTGIYLTFCGAAGSTLQTATPLQWVTGSFIGSTGMSNQLATASTLFRVARVGLYLDPDNTGVAPPWQMPDYASELAACRRYYANYAISFAVSGVATAGGQSFRATFPFQTQMRTAPTATLGTLTNNNSGAGMTISSPNIDGIRGNISSAAAGEAYSIAVAVMANARM